MSRGALGALFSHSDSFYSRFFRGPNRFRLTIWTLAEGSFPHAILHCIRDRIVGLPLFLRGNKTKIKSGVHTYASGGVCHSIVLWVVTFDVGVFWRFCFRYFRQMGLKKRGERKRFPFVFPYRQQIKMASKKEYKGQAENETNTLLPISPFLNASVLVRTLATLHSNAAVAFRYS